MRVRVMMLVSVIARMIPLLVDSMVAVFLSIVVDLAQYVPTLSALLVLLLPHVPSIALKLLPLVP